VTRWDRLSDISTSTHQYLNKLDSQKMIQEAAAKIGKIELTKRRLDGQARHASQGLLGKSLPTPPSHPGAVELPGEDVPPRSPTSPYHTPRTSTIDSPYPYQDAVSSQDKFMVLPSDDIQPRISGEAPYRRSSEYKYDSPNSVSPRRSGEDYGRPEAPPIPPKTPIYGDSGGLRPPNSARLSTGNPKPPYPDFDGPPLVNKLRKPQYNPG
jgi:hypothetical protein